MFSAIVNALSSSIGLLAYESSSLDKYKLISTMAPPQGEDSVLHVCSRFGAKKLVKEITCHNANEALSQLQLATIQRTELEKQCQKQTLRWLPMEHVFYEEQKGVWKVYLVFRLETLKTGRQVLEEYKEKLTIRERLRILIQITEFLQFIHSKKWIHGALSWDNIFWDKKRDKFFIGDVNRAKPSNFTKASDVVALAVMLFECMTYTVYAFFFVGSHTLFVAN
jgi:serine/threonine protein kinase